MPNNKTHEGNKPGQAGSQGGGQGGMQGGGQQSGKQGTSQDKPKSGMNEPHKGQFDKTSSSGQFGSQKEESDR